MANKISNMPRIEAFEGDEISPLVKNGSNYAATFDALREYFRDSSLVIFDAIDDVENPYVSDEPFEGDYLIRGIVYLSSVGIFVERVKRAVASRDYYYSSSFTRRNDYMAGTNVRRDRVFFNTSDKELYVFNGALHNIFDTVRINAMTEEEFNNLQNPIEGAFYATYEE